MKKALLFNMITKSSLTLLGLGLMSELNATTKQDQLPNIIFILADDLGMGDLGCYGQKVIKTPAIDYLAGNGMRFTQHYSGSTVSAPSRCVLLTGKHTGHSYIRGNRGYVAEDGRKYDLPLEHEEITVGEILKTRGYTTACIGKWGLGGPDSEGHPNNQGFDYFFGYLGQVNAHCYFPTQLFENSSVVKLEGKIYSHDMIVDKALNFIDKNSDKPFFLYMTPTIPHAELVVPDNEYMGYEDDFSEKPFKGSKTYCSQDKPRAAYAAMVTRLDRDVKRIMDKLSERNILNNTIIIFTSDNGTHHEGGHDPDYFDSNSIYRGGKRDLYEGGIKTPFIVYWNNVIKKGSTSDHQSAFWDFMPTVCELTGAKLPENSDGISYLPAMLDNGVQKKHDYLYFEFFEQGGKRAVIKDNWKLIQLNVNKNQKSCFELYDINSDPGETEDLSSVNSKKVLELKKLMKQAHQENEFWKFAFEK